jgi:sortase A
LQSTPATTSRNSVSWNSKETARGRALAAYLRQHQVVSVPKRLLAAIPSGKEPPTRMVIAKIRLNAPVVETPPVNGEWEVADWGVGHLTTTPNPGVAGNMALSAHDDIKGEIFKRLDELRPGDDVHIYTRHLMFTYTVVSSQVVDPTDVSVLNPTSQPTVTLISCTPYWVDTQRLIVRAVLKSRSVA